MIFFIKKTRQEIKTDMTCMWMWPNCVGVDLLQQPTAVCLCQLTSGVQREATLATGGRSAKECELAQRRLQDQLGSVWFQL
jgi:hypothetical protein